MDITFGEYDAAINDPDRKEAMISELMSKVEIIEDQNGEKAEIIRLKDIILTPGLLKGISGDAKADMPYEVKKKMAAMFSKMSGMSASKMSPGDLEMRYKNCSNVEIRDDDVVVISFPKTGTHWFCNLIHFMLKTGPLENEVSFQPPLMDLVPKVMVEAIPSPRVLATHLTPEYVPKDIFKGKGKAILIFRNPKDATVSLFHHLRNAPNFGKMELSWNCFVENSLKGLIPMMDFFDYYNKWQKTITERPDTNILVMYYEKMKKDPINELKKMNDFLGLSNDETRLQQVLDKCSINNLRNDINSGKVASPLVDKDGKSGLYRKGVIGDWKNYFTVAQSEAMDEKIKAKFKDSMFEIIY